MKAKFFEKNKGTALDKVLDYLQGETLRFLMGVTSELTPLVKFSVQPIEKKLNAKEAMQEIDKLGVTGLLVLLDNYQYGLRGKHLRDLAQHSSPINAPFTYHYLNAIKILIQEKNQSPEKAIEILINASPEEIKNLTGSSINYSDFEQTLDMAVYQDILNEEKTGLGFEW